MRGWLTHERDEFALEGGAQTPGVVRVGDTIRRPLHARSTYVHKVLEHLRAVGFDGAPRVLGIDDQNREILNLCSRGRRPGGTSQPVRRAPGLRRATYPRVPRRNDRRPLAGAAEVVCHGDLGPHNIVFDDQRAVGIIDWDDGVAPGRRLVDLAHAVWCCADIGDDAIEIAEQARMLRLMCDAYGWQDTSAIVDEIAARFRRARDSHTAQGRPEAANVFENLIDWMARNARALKTAP